MLPLEGFLTPPTQSSSEFINTFSEISKSILDKEKRPLHTDSKTERRREDEHLMDCQYEYVPADPSDHYGFLSHHTGDCINPVAEKGITSLQ
jgi:hypothetical protein